LRESLGLYERESGLIQGECGGLIHLHLSVGVGGLDGRALLDSADLDLASLGGTGSSGTLLGDLCKVKGQ